MTVFSEFNDQESLEDFCAMDSANCPGNQGDKRKISVSRKGSTDTSKLGSLDIFGIKVYNERLENMVCLWFYAVLN